MSTWSIPHQYMYSTQDLDYQKKRGTTTGTLDDLSKQSKKYLTPMLLMSSFLAALSSTMYGYNMSKLNTPYHIIISFINETYAERYNESASSTSLMTIWSIIISAFVGAGAVGSFCSGILADKFGRKRALLINHVFVFISAACELLSKYTKIYELLIVGRIFIGFNAGASQGLVSLYLTEICPKEIRGAILSLHQCGVVIGILLGQILSVNFLLGSEELWPFLCAFSVVPITISCIFFPFCPESPRYLLVNKKNEPAAKAALQKLCKTQKIMNQTIAEIKKEESLADYVTKSNPNVTRDFSYLDLVRKPELRRSLLISLLMNTGQQWSGINAVFAYSHSVFANAGVSEDNIQYAIIGTGVINVAVTFVAIAIVERVGRRKLLIGPSWVLVGASVLISIVVGYQKQISWLNHVTIALMLCYIVGFGLGMGPLVSTITCETFEQQSRPAAMAVAQAVHYASNFVLIMVYKFIESALREKVFLLFAGIVVLSTLTMTMCLPETANRSVKEVVKDIKNGWYYKPCSDEKDAAEETMVQKSDINEEQNDKPKKANMYTKKKDKQIELMFDV